MIDPDSPIQANTEPKDPVQAPATPETPTTAASAELQPAQVGALEAQIAELKDQALRAQAELQNTRRRGQEEITKVRKFAVESFAESLLPVLDSLEAALATENATTEQLREGSEATQRQLLAAMARNLVTEINPQPGDKFDPTREHAISAVPDSGQQPGAIVAVLQKGYLIAERVLRPALVTVAKSD